MTDFFDGFLPELDLAGETLPDPEAPMDVPGAESVVETEVITETWFAEVDSVVPEVAELALPDPFAAEAGIGAAAAIGGLLARRRKPQSEAPAPATRTPEPPGASPLNAETIAAAIELGRTSASLVDRLAKLAPRRRAK
jgi:hypothetical protein